MSEFKGTKGKWIHRQFPDGQNSVRTLDDSRKICVPRVHNREESDANMLLISKAPEMLGMLEELVKELSFHGYNNSKAIYDAKQLIKEATEL